jgi:hypothetical protein
MKIWIFNDDHGPVRVDLKDVVKVSFSNAYTHEEGYSAFAETYWLEDELARCNYVDSGTDCDGYHERGGVLVWDGTKKDSRWADRMAEWHYAVDSTASEAVKAYQEKKQLAWKQLMSDVVPPIWSDHDAYMRDSYAEEMGY